MPGNTSISWTQKSWNPVSGCTEISRGCDHCYAREFAERFRGVEGNAYEQGFDLKLWPERLNAPRKWPAGTRVFVNSMSDLFQSGVKDDYVDQVFEVMRACPDIIFQVLTKRPKRMAKYLNDRGYEPGMIPQVWCGTSIEDRDVVGRADELRKCPVDVRFISAEPLIGPLLMDDTKLDGDRDTATGYYPCWSDDYRGEELELEGVHWLIAGGESGFGARLMDETWVRALKHACDDASTAFFYKQLGSVLAHQRGAKGKGEDPLHMPEDLRIREYPAGLPAEDLLQGPEMTPRLF